MSTSRVRTYSELMQIHTFEERFEYLAIHGQVGVDSFGFDRYFNQAFYRSREWQRVRSQVILRDLGCDLGIEGYEIHSNLLVHHMNPIRIGDIRGGSEQILNPEFLITTTHRTHNAIHYSDPSQLPRKWTERKPGDTKPW